VTHSVGTPELWTAFTVLILLLLSLDLLIFHHSDRDMRHREALLWTAVWVALAVGFNVWLFFVFGRQHGLEFLTGYVIEYSLSIDNLFVFLLIFRYFAVPKAYQHRALFWGILGALIMRAAFIVAGTFLIQTFQWIIYVFGAFLVFSGIRMLRGEEIEVHPESNPVVRAFQRFVPVSSQYSGSRFFVRQGIRRLATPLLLVLVVIDVMDMVFAVDSIPAVFAVTRDSFIVYTSNIFAVLGLRALYFVLAAAMTQFRYLSFGLGAVLCFVGLKMLASEFYDLPVMASLSVVATLLGLAVAASVLWPGSPAAEEGASEEKADAQ
jgi:TerC family integral membrane protein